ncbi:Lar family restriction alleviation protein [Rhizobium phaseoli]|uniref:Lar family restriction alleviation protein n=1 Tax=Rhizobium phaseoli TaxID=396 RepID=UPI003D6EFD24
MISSFRTSHHVPPSVFGMEARGCPFCGSTSVAVYAGFRNHVSCMTCGADGPVGERGADPRDAVARWNSRPEVAE